MLILWSTKKIPKGNAPFILLKVVCRNVIRIYWKAKEYISVRVKGKEKKTLK
jgi:hypothetical protein